jgi:hypothetical protein
MFGKKNENLAGGNILAVSSSLYSVWITKIKPREIMVAHLSTEEFENSYGTVDPITAQPSMSESHVLIDAYTELQERTRTGYRYMFYNLPL